MNIYVVKTGGGVEGYFSTPENAEAYIAMQPVNEYTNYRVEDYIVDPNIFYWTRGDRLFRVSMHRDGTGEVQFCTYEKNPNIKLERRPQLDVLVVRCFAKTAAQAMSIADNFRVQWIDDGKWEEKCTPMT